MVELEQEDLQHMHKVVAYVCTYFLEVMLWRAATEKYFRPKFSDTIHVTSHRKTI